MQLLVCFCKTVLIIFTYQLGFLENVCCLVRGSSSQHGPYVPLRDPHQVCKGPLENDRELGSHSNFWVAHWNFTAWINISNLKLNQRFSFPPYIQQHRRQSCLLLLLPTSYLVDWFQFGDICCQKYVTALMFWEVIFAYHWPHCNWMFTNLQVFIRPKECPENNANY